MKTDFNKADESNGSNGRRKQCRCGPYSLNIANLAHLMSMSLPPPSSCNRGQPCDAMFCLQYGVDNTEKLGAPNNQRICKPNECKQAKEAAKCFKCCNPTYPTVCSRQAAKLPSFSKRFNGDKQKKNKTKDDFTQTNITCNPNQCAMDKLFEPPPPKEETIEDEEIIIHETIVVKTRSSHLFKTLNLSKNPSFMLDEEANDELLSSKLHKSESFASPNLSRNGSLILKDQTGEKLLSVTKLFTPKVEDQNGERNNPLHTSQAPTFILQDSLNREEDKDLANKPNSINEQNVLDMQDLDSDAIKSEMHVKHKNRESNEKKSLEEDLLNEKIDMISKDRRTSSRIEKILTEVKTDHPILKHKESAETLVKTESTFKLKKTPEETINQKHMHKETFKKLIKEDSFIGKDLKEYEEEYKEIDEDITKSIKKLEHTDNSEKAHSDDFDNVSNHFDAPKSDAQTTEFREKNAGRDSEMGVDVLVYEEDDTEKATHTENVKKAPSYIKTRNLEKIKKYPQGPTRQTENSNAFDQQTFPLYASFSGACGCRFSCPNAYSRMIMYGYQPGGHNCAGQTWCPYCRCCCRFCQQNLRH